MSRRRHPLLGLIGSLLVLQSTCSSVVAGRHTDPVWVRSEPCARVIVDGEAQGTTPLCLELVSTVGHSIRLERAGYEVHETLVRPMFSLGFLRRILFGGALGAAASTVDACRGGAQRLSPGEIDVILRRTADLDARLASLCLVP
jgi:hypothetical protein